MFRLFKNILPLFLLGIFLLSGCTAVSETGTDNTSSQVTSSHISSQTTSTPSETQSSTQATQTSSDSQISLPQNSSSKVPVLMFHYVRDVDKSKDLLGYNLSVEPAFFEKILKLLSDNGYTTIHIEDFLQGKVPPKSVILTFDDGYEDFYTAAWPLLKKYNFTASIAIITNRMDGGTYMSPEQVKELSQQGVEVVSHSVHHPDLNKASAKDAQKEVEQSKSFLDKLLGKPVDVFVYPSGKYNDETIQLVKQAGYAVAFTTKPGFADMAGKLFEEPRIRIDNRVSLKSMAKALKITADDSVQNTSSQEQHMKISKAEAIKLAEKFIADQKKWTIGEVFPDANGAKLSNNQWVVGFTYLSHFKEDQLKAVSMDINGSNIRVVDDLPKEEWLDSMP